MGSKFIFLVLQVKKLGHREHRSFAQVYRPELSLNLNPSQLSLSEFLCPLEPLAFPSSPQIQFFPEFGQKQDTQRPGKALATAGFIRMGHWVLKLGFVYDYAGIHVLTSFKGS